MFSAFLRSMRPHQWAKNGLIFAPLLFSKQLVVFASVWRAVVAFLLFSFLAGSIYILNDLVDIEQDREHPQKSRRPIPSGAFPEAIAWKAWPALALGSLLVALAFSWKFGAVALAYFLINLSYSFRLKNIVFLDVLCIASGFVLRVLGGAFAIGVVISTWLLPCTFLLALFLALGKRRHELSTHGEKSTRAVLDHYRLDAVDLALGITSSLAILSYCGYTLDPSTIAKFKTPHLIYTIPFVVFAIVRFLQLMNRGAQMESPTQELLRDIPSIVNVILYFFVVIYIIY